MSEPWYAEGLRFTCTQCGKCCTGEPGAVRITSEEADLLARLEGLTREEFETLRTRRIRNEASLLLRERSDGSCVYWSSGRGCEVYEARPRQCRTFPFWRRHLETEAHWSALTEECPGAGRGEIFDQAAIEERLADDGTSGIVPKLPPR